MKGLINFLTRDSCGRCKQLHPKVVAFAEEKGYKMVERNVDHELLPQDIRVLRATGQKSLPIIYFQGENTWSAVNPNTWNLEAAEQFFVDKESEYLTFEEE